MHHFEKKQNIETLRQWMKKIRILKIESFNTKTWGMQTFIYYKL